MLKAIVDIGVATVTDWLTASLQRRALVLNQPIEQQTKVIMAAPILTFTPLADNLREYLGLQEGDSYERFLESLFPAMVEAHQRYIIKMKMTSPNLVDPQRESTTQWRRLKTRMSLLLSFKKLDGVMIQKNIVHNKVEEVYIIAACDTFLADGNTKLDQYCTEARFFMSEHGCREGNEGIVEIREFLSVKALVAVALKDLQDYQDVNTKVASTLKFSRGIDILRYGVDIMIQEQTGLPNEYFAEDKTFEKFEDFDRWLTDESLFREHRPVCNRPSLLYWMRTHKLDAHMKEDVNREWKTIQPYLYDREVMSDLPGTDQTVKEALDKGESDDPDLFTTEMKRDIMFLYMQYYIVSKRVVIPRWRLKSMTLKKELKDFWEYSVVTLKWVDKAPITMASQYNPFV